MVRSFSGEPVSAEAVTALCDLARRAPSAGNSQAISFVALVGSDAVARYWDVTLAPDRRPGFRWPGLLAAPALLVVAVEPDRYVARYGEPDKVASGLGRDRDAWSVPYWWVDAGAAIEHVLLGAVDAGLGACLFGLFDHESAVAAELGVPDGVRLVGTIALGHPRPAADAERDPDPAGRSVSRPRRPLDAVVHLGRW